MNQSSAQPTLLIVDDTPDNIRVLFEYLSDTGYNVLVCESGEAALATLEIEEPDLILLDVMMPGLDGLETCRRIKQLPAGSDVPVFFMTALDDPFDKVRGLEVGAVDYLTKPVYPEEVLARIRTHLEIRQLQKALQEQNERLDSALQRSITAEQELSESLGRAVLVVNAKTREVLFATRQAETLIARHGGTDALKTWLTDDTQIVDGPEGRRLEISRDGPAPGKETLLITLREQTREPAPEDLNSLGLTPRETEILFWVAQGKTSPEIAIILNTQLCTVKKHVGNLLPKLGVETRLAAALRAHEVLAEKST